MNRCTLAVALTIFACDQVNAPAVDDPCPLDPECHAQGGALPGGSPSGAGAGGERTLSGGASAGGYGASSAGASAAAGFGAGPPDCPDGVCGGASGGVESAGAGAGGRAAGGSSDGGASAGASPTATGGSTQGGAGGAPDDTTPGGATCVPGDADVALVCFPPSTDPSYPFLMSGLRFKYPNTSDTSRGLEVAAINDHGVAIGTSSTCGSSRAFSYADGVFTLLSDENSRAAAINNRGTIVGMSGGRAVMWRNGETVPLGFSPKAVVAINEHDQVLARDGGQAASLWTDGVETPIGERLYVLDLNDAGEVVGVDFKSGPNRAFVWKNGVFRDLPPLEGDSDSRANAINDQGQVVGWSSRHAVIWENGVPRLLSPQPSSSEVSIGSAADINNAGSVVGWTLGFGTFLYSSGTFTRVGSVSDNLRINDNGVIVGDKYIWSSSCYDICCSVAGAR